MRRNAAVIGACVLGALLASGSERVEASEIVGVLDFETRGVSKTAAKKFETSIEEGLSGSGFKVAPRSRLMALLRRSSYIPGCYFGPCLNEVWRNTKVRLVLVARVTAAGPSYSFVVSLFDTKNGQLTSQVSDRCDVCTLQDAITTTTLKVIALVEGVGGAKVSDPKKGPTGVTTLSSVRAELADLKQTLAARRAASRTRVRRVALFLLSAAAITAGSGVFLRSRDENTAGYAAFGAAGGLTFASATLLVLSGRF